MKSSARDASLLRLALIVTVLAGSPLLVTGVLAWSPLAVADDPLLRMPGTQPGAVTLEAPTQCFNCHADFDDATEPATVLGSMMSQAARDPLYWASLTVAAQDSIWALGRPNGSDLCLRCHFPQGWLEGRSDPTNGSEMDGADFDGVHCGLCHRLIDPFFETTYDGSREGSDWPDYWDETNLSETPSQAAADATYAADEAVSETITLFNGDPFFDSVDDVPHSSDYEEGGGGQFFIATDSARRGPFADANTSHSMAYSRYHKSRYFCSTCHDVSNSALANLAFDGTPPGDGPTVLPTENESAFAYAHVERTFSEFMLSDFGLQGGAPGSGPFAPEVFETSLANDFIARCQDCHMPDTSGRAAGQNKSVLRPSQSVEHPNSGVPAHDLTGGNVWIPRILASTVSGLPGYDAINDALLSQGPAVLTLDLTQGLGIDVDRLLAGADRAVANLQAAAGLEEIDFELSTGALSFRIRNHTGHKLISGFPEGRRMWINVQAYDEGGSLTSEINPYDAAASTLKGLSFSYDDPDQVLPNPLPLGSSEQHLDELVYEMVTSSSLTGEDHTFHAVLADGRFKDNRIPPRGFRIAEAAERLSEPAWNGSPAPGLFTADEYAGGYDQVSLTLPPGTTEIVISLYYQTTSREYVEFLRDEINGTASTLIGTGAGGDPPYLAQTDPFFGSLKAWGDTIWQLWRHNRQVAGAAPVLMTRATILPGGTIVVEKRTMSGNAPATFTFSGDASGEIGDGEQIAVADLPPGPYSVSESLLPGWELRSITCDDTNSTGELSGATASYDLDSGETVTCVFLNCQLDLVLSEDTAEGTRSYEACDSITASGFTVASHPGGTDVVFRARRLVELRDGFVVEADASFRVALDPGI